MLSMYVGAHQKDWDIYIPYVLLVYTLCPINIGTALFVVTSSF